MSKDLEYPGELKVLDEENQDRVIPVNTKEEIHDLFNRAAFDGERIIMTSGEAAFGIVPIEDVLLLDAEWV